MPPRVAATPPPRVRRSRDARFAVWFQRRQLGFPR